MSENGAVRVTELLALSLPPDSELRIYRTAVPHQANWHAVVDYLGATQEFPLAFENPPAGSFQVANAVLAALLRAGDHWQFQRLHMHVPLKSDDPRTTAYVPDISVGIDCWAYVHTEGLEVAVRTLEEAIG